MRKRFQSKCVRFLLGGGSLFHEKIVNLGASYSLKILGQSTNSSILLCGFITLRTILFWVQYHQYYFQYSLQIYNFPLWIHAGKCLPLVGFCTSCKYTSFGLWTPQVLVPELLQLNTTSFGLWTIFLWASLCTALLWIFREKIVNLGAPYKP